jgi:hypothetical protein
MARADAAARPLVGCWRITAMELWTAEDLELLGPARLTLNRDGSGEMSLLNEILQRRRVPRRREGRHGT